jgi:hypothetical protein
LNGNFKIRSKGKQVLESEACHGKGGSIETGLSNEGRNQLHKRGQWHQRERVTVEQIRLLEQLPAIQASPGRNRSLKCKRLAYHDNTRRQQHTFANMGEQNARLPDCGRSATVRVLQDYESKRICTNFKEARLMSSGACKR